MSTVMVPASSDEALDMLESAMGFLAGVDPTSLPGAELARGLQVLERTDAVEAAVRGRLLEVFDSQDGHVADGQRTARTWLVHVTRVTKGQAAERQAVERLAREHPVLLAGLAEGRVLTKSVALQLAKWTRAIPGEYRDEAEEIVMTAARAGADLRALAAICAEIRYLTAPPDPGEEKDKLLDRGVSLATTFDGAGVIHGDLSPECAAMVQAVLDALSAPAGGEDLRTRPERYHDALGEAMKRLLASDLLPKRAGQPVKALVHISFAELCALDTDSGLQDAWITGYRARWAAYRAAASVSTGDGGAWLDGDKARAVACDAMIIPVVTGDVDPGAVEELIALCACYHHLRTGTADPAGIPGGSGSTPDGTDTGSTGAAAPGSAAVPAGLASRAARQGDLSATVAASLAEMEHQILAKILQVLSGPGGVASFLRRQLLGQGLNGPSLPLDVGQTDDIPVHLRRLVALRDQKCQHPGGCDQPAAGCEPHHVVHRKDGGTTSLANLKDYCWWHHHVVLHELGWELTVHPDGTSQVRSPAGKTIRSHSPPPRPG
ncbi:MAG TPA: DUF222 domain-containing protein [Streptosporangiaceae bacterium]|nr:DUF222 domain-containing protein [Streptosporangiaceae bacterium]